MILPSNLKSVYTCLNLKTTTKAIKSSVSTITYFFNAKNKTMLKKKFSPILNWECSAIHGVIGLTGTPFMSMNRNLNFYYLSENLLIIKPMYKKISFRKSESTFSCVRSHSIPHPCY